ncbi:MAG TPA: hypothetical protein VHS96_15080, partial [Bacteroidia bacterium]|nr:hypothetical protein [Bacteroidia bacterium]
MEPHSEKKGRLGDKFEGFQHAPGEDVWERIAATPTDRPLGARFRGFAVLPRRRVWRNISAVLHPQVQRRAIVWWSAAAGAAILLGIGLLWQSPSGATAKRFAATQWQEPIPTQPNGNPGTLPTNAIPTDGAPSTAATLSLQSNTPINHLTDNGFRNPKDQSTRKPDAVGSMEPTIAGTRHTDDA